MSHDPRYISSPPRPPSARVDERVRPPAGFYRARIVEIKRRGPSARLSSQPVEQQHSVDSPRAPAEQQHPGDPPRYGSSPPVRISSAATANMSGSPRRAKNHALSSTSPGRHLPPAPPPHSPSQRSVSIAQGSYMDYNSNTPSSRSAHFRQPYHQSMSPPNGRQQRDEFELERSPATAVRSARGFRYEVEEQLSPHQSVPPPRFRRRREEHEEYDPRRLLPTAVRPPQAFQFELEEEPPAPHSDQPDVPGRFPSSPDVMEAGEESADTHMGGIHEDVPKLRPQAGSYRELQPYELGMIYSNPTSYQNFPRRSDSARQNLRDPARPFIYEIRSPRKADHDGSNKAAATSQQAAYGARNPAKEAAMYPLLRHLGADERYATSFRTERGGTAEPDLVNDHGSQASEMVEARTSGGIDVKVVEMERRRADRRTRQ